MKSSKAMILAVMKPENHSAVERPEIFFITARIIALLDFISAAHYMIRFIYQMTSSQRQWLHSSVG